MSEYARRITVPPLCVYLLNEYYCKKELIYAFNDILIRVDIKGDITQLSILSCIKSVSYMLSLIKTVKHVCI